jgi:hypothetical protein
MAADHINGTALPQIAKFIFNELPPDAYGSPEIVIAWLECRAEKDEARNDIPGGQ